MKPNKIFKGSFIMAVALAAVFALAAAWPCASVAAGQKECGLIGTWAGHAYASMYWLGVHTAGSTGDKNGEMLLNWIWVDDSLLRACNTATSGTCGIATRMTPGHGVWQEIGKGQYNYTWYAYGIDDSGTPVFSVRVSGLATNTDCDNVAIVFTYEVFAAPVFPPQDTSGLTPVVTIPGAPGKSGETRVPLTAVTPTP